MKLAFKKTTCRVLVVSLLALSFQTAHAGLIGADQAAAGSTNTERTMLLNTLERSDAIQQLQSAGVDPLAARERVQTMSDQEVHALAQQVQAAPAGGDVGAVLVIILVAALIWYYLIRK